MKPTLAFDIYGTLIDTAGVTALLQTMIGDKATLFSQTWRDKQLEYSFRHGLMDDYVEFGVCTLQALNYTNALLQTELDEQAIQQLMQQYTVLPAFSDVRPTLETLKAQGIKLCAFSNGTRAGVEKLLQNAEIADFFDDVISVDEVKTFKPSPVVYDLCIQRSGANKEHCWLISGNTFDILGAKKFGLKTAWVKREPNKVFDPWDQEPDQIITDLRKLGELF